MKTRSWLLPILLAVAASCVADDTAAQGTTAALRRTNIGLIVDAPFLAQDELPRSSDYYGAYDDELVVFDYKNDLPVRIRYAASDSGTLLLDVGITYTDDGHIQTLTYATYDDTGESIAYVDLFTFSSYLDAGPLLADLQSSDGGSAQMHLSYDDRGRLVALDEEDAFGDGYYKRKRFSWTDEERPYAAEIRYPLDGEVERFTYLYDSRGRLRATDGVNILEDDSTDVASISEWFAYRSGSLEEIFGRVQPGTKVGTTASR